jgi:uncharacterized protein (TIGR02646 family)
MMEGASFSGFGDKDNETGETKPLKKAIAKEQGYICCYCMRRIYPEKDFRVSPNEMTVEHYVAQAWHPDSPYDPDFHRLHELDYGNLLGSCKGDGRDCSEIRGNRPLTIDPRKEECEALVRFKKNGEAKSTDSRIEKEINEVLMLNTKRLVLNRKAVIDQARRNLPKKNSNQPLRKSSIASAINDWLRLENGQYREYCMAAVHYLQSKMQKAQ